MGEDRDPVPGKGIGPVATIVAIALAMMLLVAAATGYFVWRSYRDAEAAKAALARTTPQERLLGYWVAPELGGDAAQAWITTETIDYYEYPVTYEYDGTTLYTHEQGRDITYGVEWIGPGEMVWIGEGGFRIRWVRDPTPWQWDCRAGRRILGCMALSPSAWWPTSRGGWCGRRW